ncbi:MAG: sugar transferase [Saprospiraceae bacterium]|nr:sugar transferase [Saprospiraceae bacterium]
MYLFLKRIIDIVLTLVALLLLSPLMLPIILVLKFTAEGEVWYFQKRIGLNNQYFDIWKFATMLKNSPSIGSGTITVRNDPRVTPIGKFLRKSKINELPQIINVLIGDMSIVGPRPLDDRAFNDYSKEVQTKIYKSKPGITGIGSIIFRDEELLVSSTEIHPHEYYRKFIAPYKGALEMWYQQNASLFTDFKIIFLTAWQIFFPKSNFAYKLFKHLPARPDFLSTN